MVNEKERFELLIKVSRLKNECSHLIAQSNMKHNVYDKIFVFGQNARLFEALLFRHQQIEIYENELKS